GSFVAIRPPQPCGCKAKRGLIGTRPHDVAVDRLEERLDESWVHGVPAYEFVCGFEPVDAPVLASDEAVEARRHVDRYARIRVCHRFVPRSSATASIALGTASAEGPMATFSAHTASPPPLRRTPAGSRALSRHASIAPRTTSAHGPLAWAVPRTRT